MPESGLLLEIMRGIGLDLGLIYGVPWVKGKIFGKKMSADDRAIMEEANKLLREGKREEARKVLARGIFGVGLADEEILDEDYEAVVRAGLATKKEVMSLQAWLAGTTPEKRRLRSRFRGALTLQKDYQARLRVMAEYAKLKSDAERQTRMESTGKLDPEIDEIVWEWFKTNVPGISRESWDAICRAADATWDRFVNGIDATGRGIANGAEMANDRFNTLGVGLQGYARRGFPPPIPAAARPPRTRRTVMEWFEDLFA